MADLELLKYIFFLTKINKLGNVKIKNIVQHLSQPEEFYKCSLNKLRQINGIDTALSDEILYSLKNRDKCFREFEQIYNNAFKQNINIVSFLDESFPENLNRIFDTPVLLYYKGKLSDSDKYSLSIVGTRSPTEYGKYNCEKFAEQLSELNILLVSGFARGIDTIVHKTSLKKNNHNYAIFGCGADVVYPYENRKLYFDLIDNGAVISEFPIGTKPDKMNFPRRNRIISGISLGTLVIESGIKGGALLTAEIAVDQDREVFALPGYINSKQSEGANELIKRGQAKLVSSVEDIICELEIKLRPVLKRENASAGTEIINDLSGMEEKIFSAVDFEPLHIDDITEKTQLSVQDCLVNLLSLEFKSLVRQIPGKFFIRNN